jgi:CRP/FNR family cyclic AMP-dependent transcriptional regulator
MRHQKALHFDAQAFLDSTGIARKLRAYQRREVIFSQGDPAQSVLYIQKGSIKLTVTSGAGKEAVVAVLGPGDFLGEGCLAGQPSRMSRATAIAASTIVVIDKQEMTRVLHREHAFSDRFISFLT